MCQELLVHLLMEVDLRQRPRMLCRAGWRPQQDLALGLWMAPEDAPRECGDHRAQLEAHGFHQRQHRILTQDAFLALQPCLDGRKQLREGIGDVRHGGRRGCVGRLLGRLLLHVAEGGDVPPSLPSREDALGLEEELRHLRHGLAQVPVHAVPDGVRVPLQRLHHLRQRQPASRLLHQQGHLPPELLGHRRACRSCRRRWRRSRAAAEHLRGREEHAGAQPGDGHALEARLPQQRAHVVALALAAVCFEHRQDCTPCALQCSGVHGGHVKWLVGRSDFLLLRRLLLRRLQRGDRCLEPRTS
mmetsp:Transcript_36609/g.115157  ORF Transcript_36609/g.115157 Transcript_36609/m.115157 type:complete len:301 (+) Transcript_36609:1440-2342(+)